MTEQAKELHRVATCETCSKKNWKSIRQDFIDNFEMSAAPEHKLLTEEEARHCKHLLAMMNDDELDTFLEIMRAGFEQSQEHLVEDFIQEVGGPIIVSLPLSALRRMGTQD